jgi:hypothetical protein
MPPRQILPPGAWPLRRYNNEQVDSRPDWFCWSEVCPGVVHNRSDQKREDPPDLEDLKALRKEFDELEANLRASRKAATKGRTARKEAKATEKLGW